MAYVVRYHPRVADEDVPRIANENKRRIERAIATRLASEPQRFGAPLTGTLRGCWKLRVGDHRVVFSLSGTDVFVLAIVHRRDAYSRAERRAR